MRHRALPLVLAPVLLVGCATHRETRTEGTLAELRTASPDLEEVAQLS